jgi:hypothetical protein
VGSEAAGRSPQSRWPERLGAAPALRPARPQPPSSSLRRTSRSGSHPGWLGSEAAPAAAAPSGNGPGAGPGPPGGLAGASAGWTQPPDPPVSTASLDGTTTSAMCLGR